MTGMSQARSGGLGTGSANAGAARFRSWIEQGVRRAQKIVVVERDDVLDPERRGDIREVGGVVDQVMCVNQIDSECHARREHGLAVALVRELSAWQERPFERKQPRTSPLSLPVLLDLQPYRVACRDVIDEIRIRLSSQVPDVCLGSAALVQ